MKPPGWVPARLGERRLAGVDSSAATRIIVNSEVIDLEAGGDNVHPASPNPSEDPTVVGSAGSAAGSACVTWTLPTSAVRELPVRGGEG